MPKVSVVMPAYNAEKYIGEAIDSILSQTFTDFEFIIIDDGSTDRTKEIVLEYDDPRIVLLENEKNSGIVVTLNKGLDAAKGEYIARMDADDISLPERFEKQVEYMDENPGVAVVGTGIQLFGAQNGKRNFSTDYQSLKVDLLFGCCFAHPSVMFRTLFFGEGKLQYDDNFNKMEDYDLWVRTSELYEIASLSDVLLKYRIHPNQVTQNKSDANQYQLRMLKERQISAMGIFPDGSGFESYVSYCNGRFDINVDQIIDLASFFTLLRKKNRITVIYEDRILKKNFDAVIKGLLAKLDGELAIKTAGRCNLCPVIYGINRLVHGGITRIGGEIRERQLQSKLKSKDFTIISNNCWGGAIYQKYGLAYRSPTAGLFLLGHDFVKFAERLDHYISCELEFIPWEESSYYEVIKNNTPYPVARLDDIEIYFMHYPTEEEAAEKWYRRAKRINQEHILYKLSQREGCSKEDVERFMSLPLHNKICFAYDEVEGTIHIPELRNWSGDETPLIEQYYDELTILNLL